MQYPSTSKSARPSRETPPHFQEGEVLTDYGDTSVHAEFTVHAASRITVFSDRAGALLQWRHVPPIRLQGRKQPTLFFTDASTSE